MTASEKPRRINGLEVAKMLLFVCTYAGNKENIFASWHIKVDSHEVRIWHTWVDISQELHIKNVMTLETE